MAQYNFTLPDLGEGIVEAEIVALHAEVGDSMLEDQPLIDMMTDKATVEIPSPVTGKILTISGKPGDIIRVGSVMVAFEVEGAGNVEKVGLPEKAEPKIKAASIKRVSVPIITTPKITGPKITGPKITGPKITDPKITDPKITDPKITAPAGGKPLASPSVRRRALEQDIELSRVRPSGPGARISHRDLDDFIAAGGRQSTPPKQKRTAIGEIPVIGLRRKIAERMELSKRTIPHYSYVEEIDVSEVEKLRHFLNDSRAGGQPKLSILPFVMMATVKAMEKFPDCNSHYVPEQNLIRRFSGVHLGIATQTPNGLMVPVVSHGETRDIWDMAAEMRRVTGAARAGKATRGDLTGSTVTITSLGKIGGIVTTPVINYPEVCIIGVNKIVARAVVIKDSDIQIRQMMNLSSSFDHRVVDGYVAAELIHYIKGLLELPATLFI